MLKKFLVLGIGRAQIDLLERLSGRFERHALSYSVDEHEVRHAEHFSPIDIADKDAVLAYAEQHRIDYIYSVGSDIAMPTATYVAEHLGLPSLVSHQAASTCNNKLELRERLRHCYGAVTYQLISNVDEKLSVRLPAVIKPADSQGQRGVQTIHDRSDIPAALSVALGYSKIGKAILEERIDGPEVSVHGYLVDGRMKFYLVSDRQTWPQFDGGIIHKHVFPSTLCENALANVRRLCEETVTTLGIANGPIYFQIKVRDDAAYLIEVTPRLDGCHMWRLILFATGVDLLECVVSHLQGLPVEISETQDVRDATLEFFCQRPDERFSFAETHPAAQYVEWYYRPGELVRRVNGRLEKCGYQIVAGAH
ncbi:MAG TPA: ATP-grasp domain-containing protein [Burkholderiales bacterium]|nr:ATP-grasp domain-containing protein [Burkholderiales bacterium]